MKLSIPLLASVLVLTGATALQTGCASTQTRQSTGEMVDDAAITTKVKAAFVRDPLVKALDVSVDTFKGTVQLSGFVNSAEEKAKAEQIARSVNGVMNVQNNISVK
jgi:osmotically-inducible protein OsmY